MEERANINYHTQSPPLDQLDINGPDHTTLLFLTNHHIHAPRTHQRASLTRLPKHTHNYSKGRLCRTGAYMYISYPVYWLYKTLRRVPLLGPRRHMTRDPGSVSRIKIRYFSFTYSMLTLKSLHLSLRANVLADCREDRHGRITPLIRMQPINLQSTLIKSYLMVIHD